MEVLGYALLLLAVVGAQVCLRRTYLCEKVLFWLPDRLKRAGGHDVYFPYFEVLGEA
jgi:hypothetical protein